MRAIIVLSELGSALKLPSEVGRGISAVLDAGIEPLIPRLGPLLSHADPRVRLESCRILALFPPLEFGNVAITRVAKKAKKRKKRKRVDEDPETQAVASGSQDSFQGPCGVSSW